MVQLLPACGELSAKPTEGPWGRPARAAPSPYNHPRHLNHTSGKMVLSTITPAPKA